MNKYKTLLFDFDDTLFDFSKSEIIALERAFACYGIEPSGENVEKYRKENRAYWQGFEKGLYKDESSSYIRFQNFLSAIGKSGADAQEMNNKYLDELSTTAFPIQQSDEMLKRLSTIYDIYIITNSLKRVSDARTAISGIEPYIKGRFVSEDIGVSKPNAGFFKYCFSHIPDFSPDVTLIIGDSISSDIKGGINAGIDTCWFNRRKDAKPENLPITYEVHSIYETEELLRSFK